MSVRILQGDCRDVLRTLPAASVHMIVTSPPYYSLRCYGHPDQIGLESSPDAYVAEMVAVFREAKRVLRDDGTCWIVLGDSYAAGGYSKPHTGLAASAEASDGKRRDRSGPRAQFDKVGGRVGSNLANGLSASIKGSVLFFGARCTLTVAAKGKRILRANKAAPDGEFTTLFGVKRVAIKQGNDNFCQVLHLLHPESAIRVPRSARWLTIDEANADVVLDPLDDLEIVVSQHDLNAKAALKVAILPGAAKDGQAAFAVEEAAKPVAKGVRHVQSARNAVALDAAGERLLNVDPVNKPVSFADALMSGAEGLRDFRVTKASREHFALTLMDGRVKLTVGAVGHLFASNQFGSLIRYSELYDQAQRQANATQPKQLLGIPDRVKRALQEDGWICRSSIIWHKLSPMPESVRDRPTSAHEKVFLFAKSPRYFYDAEAVQEPFADERKGASGARSLPYSIGSGRQDTLAADGKKGLGAEPGHAGRNLRNVWTITPEPYSEAHFATFPPKLPELCIKAGSPPGGTVLDPFGGAGTTGLVADRLGRNAVLIELNETYTAMTRKRLEGDAGLFADIMEAAE